MEKVNKSRIILFIIFILLIFLSFYIYDYFNKDEIEEKKEIQSKYIILDDYSRFFTVNSCVYKYISYLQNKDTKSLLEILDRDFISKNSINSNNIYNHLENLDGNYSFTSKKIYYEEINEQYIKYYVYGHLSEDLMDEIGEKQDRYYLVTFDLENYLFSIIPYDGTIFKEGENG